eukprot:scaffold2512_cov120-Cylindrotheca_fusiformis.AAC.10
MDAAGKPGWIIATDESRSATMSFSASTSQKGGWLFEVIPITHYAFPLSGRHRAANYPGSGDKMIYTAVQKKIRLPNSSSVLSLDRLST